MYNRLLLLRSTYPIGIIHVHGSTSSWPTPAGKNAIFTLTTVSLSHNSIFATVNVTTSRDANSFLVTKRLAHRKTDPYSCGRTLPAGRRCAYICYYTGYSRATDQAETYHSCWNIPQVYQLHGGSISYLRRAVQMFGPLSAAARSVDQPIRRSTLHNKAVTLIQHHITTIAWQLVQYR